MRTITVWFKGEQATSHSYSFILNSIYHRPRQDEANFPITAGLRRFFHDVDQAVDEGDWACTTSRILNSITIEGIANNGPRTITVVGENGVDGTLLVDTYEVTTTGGYTFHVNVSLLGGFSVNGCAITSSGETEWIWKYHRSTGKLTHNDDVDRW